MPNSHLHSSDSLMRDLVKLGIVKGDILFIHSSFKSLGLVAGGAGTVIEALERAVGPSGLILMPSFNLIDRERRAMAWNLERTPSTVGWLTEFFRLMPGTYRSDHYSHSVAARGLGASKIVADHTSNGGWKSPWDEPPWGKTYGTHSPMVRAYRRSGKLLMLGVDYGSSTYVHLVEVIICNEWLKSDPEAPYVALNREQIGGFWDQFGQMNRGKLGNADCRFFEIQDYVDTLLEEVRKNSRRFNSDPLGGLNEQG